MSLTVDIVMPVHGNWELTERALSSLAKRDACVRRVIVVDDASPDDSALRLRARDDVEAVLLSDNVRFSRACNIGADHSTAEAIFFLNNDTVVPPGAIERLATTSATTGAAAVGPMLVNPDGTLQVAGLALLRRNARFTRLFTHLDTTLPQANEPYEPIALSGAALLVRRDAFDAVGRFNETYVNGAEDVDLCLALWSTGYRCRYEPRSIIVHLEGATRGKDTDNTANDDALQRRWKRHFSHVPSWPEPLAPVIDLRWHSRDPLERTVHHTLLAALRAHGGSRVVDGRPLLAPLAARLDRRARISVGHRARRPTSDVVWCAPDGETEATALAARCAQRYWVPSQRAAELLIRAGISPDSIAITRPGFPVTNARERTLTHAVVVHGEPADRTVRDAVASALGQLPHETVAAARATPACLARLGGAPLVIFTDAADPWGLLATAALAGGAVAIVARENVVHELVDAGACIAVDRDAGAIADAVRETVRDFAAVAPMGPFAARDLARRSSDVHAARRIRELARAFVHGVASPQKLTMPLGISTLLRDGL